MAIPTLSPAETAAYNARRVQARGTYRAGLAQNSYQRRIGNAGYQQQRLGLTSQWNQTRNLLPGGYAQRGLLNSGIYQGGLQQYGQQRIGAFQGAEQTHFGQLGQLSQGRLDLRSTLNSSLNTIEAEQQARRATIAAGIRSAI